MAKRKAPAYQRYPKDYLSDENVALMTLEEEGAYNRLMDYCWLQGSIPADPALLARLCKTTPEHMAVLWSAIGKCFRPHPTEADRVVHPRLEKERKRQDDYHERKRIAGRKGAQRRWGKEDSSTAKDLPIAKNGPSSASASASAVRKKDKPSSTNQGPKKGRAGWTTKAGEAWRERLGEPNWGQLGRTLKPVVERHGEDVVLLVWRYYLDTQERQYISVNDFASKFEMWRDWKVNGKGPAQPKQPRDPMREALTW